MIDLLSAPSSSVFVASLGVMFLLCVVEGLALAFAGTMTPSFIDWDTDGVSSSEAPNGVLAYLNAGHLPLTLFVASAAAVFGVTGLGVQQIAAAILGVPLPLYAAIPIAIIAAIPGTHMISKGLGSLLPKTETTAISSDDFIGREGEVMAGTGARGMPVQVKLRDEHGQSHYIMVEPVRDDDTLKQGQSVLITARDGVHYLAIQSVSQVISSKL